ncbi:MAG: hypothetical protein ACTSXH_11495 [Promethearchaeota archaeon]
MSENAEYKEMDSLDKAEKGGLNYINKEKSYLKISMIFPLYSLCIIIINIIFIFIGSIYLRYTPHPPTFKLTLEQKIFIGLMIMIPSLVFVILIIFSILQFIFLGRWKSKINEYTTLYAELKSKQEQNEDDFDDKTTTSTTTLTTLFYDVINHMEKIRVIFYIMNAFAIFYLWWSIRIFGAIVYLLVEEIIKYFPLMFFLNFSSSIVLIISLIYMWIHFKRWYRKLKNLRKFENTIARELNLQNGWEKE